MASKVMAGVIDGARAAAQACHASAGLLAVVRKGNVTKLSPAALSEASRLMRSAESLSRAAVAIMVVNSSVGNNGGGKSMGKNAVDNSMAVDNNSTSGGGGLKKMGSQADSISKSARRRLKKKEKKLKNESQYGGGSLVSGGSGGAQNANNAFKILEELNQTLRSSATLAPGTASSSDFVVGTNVVITGLGTKPELNNTAGQVVFDTTMKSDGRLAVKCLATGATHRFLKKNLMMSANQPLSSNFMDADMFEDGFMQSMQDY